jgi:hypothetical protein
MIGKSWYRATAILAVFLGLSAVASAQPSPPAKQQKAEKSEQKAAKKGNNGAKSAPAGTPVPGGGGQPTFLAQFGDWGAYTGNSGGKQVCYAFAKPTSSATQPPGRPRDPAYIFVASRPSENVKNEISIVVGYPFKPGYEASADIGSSKYALLTQADGAWVKNPAEEARMVETMRRGADLIVTGESGRGTKSTDRYALKGLAQALDRVAQECK